MADHPSTTPHSSPDSIPASADGSEAATPQVQRALDMYNSNKPRSNSRDTPPPPERKTRSFCNDSSAANANERRRYQFYVPEGEARGGDPPEITVPVNTNTTSTNMSSTNAPAASSGEEAAQKVRSRLIRLQNHHRDLRDNKFNLLRSTGNDVGVTGDKEDTEQKRSEYERRSQSEILGDDDEYDSPRSYTKTFVEDKKSPPPKSMPAKPSSASQESPHSIKTDRNELEQLFDDDTESYDNNEEDDEFMNINMEPIESDDEASNSRRHYVGSAPSSPTASKDDYRKNCPSSAPLDTSGRRGGGQQSMRQKFKAHGISGGGMFKPPLTDDDLQQPYLGKAGSSSKLIPPFVREEKSQQMLHHHKSRSANNININNNNSNNNNNVPNDHILATGIDMLQNAAKQARGKDEMETLHDSINYLRTLQIGRQHDVDPPTSHARVHRPPPGQKEEYQEYAIESYGERMHRPAPRQIYTSNSTQLAAPSSNVDQIKKGRFLTAAEAMSYVLSASNRPPTSSGGSINTAANDINKAYSFLNNMTNEEILEYGLTGGVGSRKSSFDSDDEDFERNTSLSMHAEEKFGAAGGSKYAEDKRLRGASSSDDDYDGSSISISEREGGDVMRGMKEFSKISSLHQSHQEVRRRAPTGGSSFDNDDASSISLSEREGGDVMHGMKDYPGSNMRKIDHHVSDSFLFRGRQSKNKNATIDPPTSDEGGVISPSVLEKNTVNQNLYAVETVIPENTYNRRSSEGLKPASFHDEHFQRRRSSDYEYDKSAYTSHAAALGPRNKKPGGVTGVNLGEYTNNNQQYDADEGYKSESFSEHSLKSHEQNSIADDAVYSSPREYGGEVDAQSTGLMTMLCGHLLPLGIDATSSQYDDTFCGMTSMFMQNSHNQKPIWNNDDPDEPGYLVHRLTNAELNSVEYAYEKLITAYGEQAAANNNFERDLEEAELVLDQEEKRYSAEMKGLKPSPSHQSLDTDASSNDSAGKAHRGSPGSRGSLYDSPTFSQDENEVRECVPDFPGIYPPGKGRTGELECFYLPVISKSQKTGFEPTKDLVLKPGTVFANNYHVQGELGSAAFSTAYRCIDLSSEEDEDGYQDEVCLKVIKNTKDYFDQSIDEIKILRLLKDTGKVQENNIVEMKSFFYHREHLVIVTELLRQNMYEFGKSIIESRGPPYFTRDRLSHITRQCLVALKFVHELGLMHCDIKPENILLRSYSRALVKVIDFGSSSFVSDRQSSYIQSRSYRAPEVILGLPYDGGIDMWSLGCVVAEMYTGEVTFQNDSEVSMLSRIEAICGPFPKHMIANGRNSHRIFTDSGLIYEKVSREDDDNDSGSDDSASDHVRVYQPKMTTMAARLGFEPDFMERPRLTEDDTMRALFIDFVSKLLTIDPKVRLTAKQALKHPWILSSLDLTEDEIRYPPSD